MGNGGWGIPDGLFHCKRERDKKRSKRVSEDCDVKAKSMMGLT